MSYTVADVGIFLNVFFKKYKFIQYNKKINSYIDNNSNKKKRKYMEFTITFYEFSYIKIVARYLIINATSYISFNVHNQVIIHPLNVEQIIEQNLILLT